MNGPSDTGPAATGVRAYAGQGRRIDALLRARFPYLVTETYETRPGRFVIVVPRGIDQVERMSAAFAESIRYVTVPVSLSNTRPDACVRCIAGLTDQGATGTMERVIRESFRLSCGLPTAGLPLTRNDRVNVLLSKFPDLDVVDVEDDDGSPIMEVTVVLGTEPSGEAGDELAAFIDALDVPVPVRTRVAPAEQRVDVRKDARNPVFVWASAPTARARLRARGPALLVREHRRHRGQPIRPEHVPRHGGRRLPVILRLHAGREGPPQPPPRSWWPTWREPTSSRSCATPTSCRS